MNNYTTKFIHNYKWFIIKQCNDVSIITADYHTIHKKKPNTRNSLLGFFGQCYAVISHRIKPLHDARLSKMFALMVANYNSVPPHIYLYTQGLWMSFVFLFLFFYEISVRNQHEFLRNQMKKWPNIPNDKLKRNTQ